VNISEKYLNTRKELQTEVVVKDISPAKKIWQGVFLKN
jgi:hypothetical protein